MAVALVVTAKFCFAQYAAVEQMSMHMETKTAKDGYKTAVKADIFYSKDGRMVSHYLAPKKYTVLNNAKGEIKIYDREANTVLQQQNYMYSTETSQFYYFLGNNKTDLGLSQMGFTQSNVKFEDGLMITEWTPPAKMVGKISKVELVLEQGKPIYIAYFDSNNKVSNKSYYYNYLDLNSVLSFPSTITQIVYTSPADSTITKTSYTDIRINNEVDQKLTNFKIPEDAKSIN